MHVLTTQAQVTASGIFPWSDWLPTGIPVNEIRSQQSTRAACTQCSAWRCCVALFDVNHGTVREGTLTLAAGIAFMFAMSMAPQRPHRQWQVNANGRLSALFSMRRGVDGSQLGRYTNVKRIYIVQCTRNWLKHKLTIIFAYFILEILITVVTAKPFVKVGWCPCAVHHVRGFTRGNWVNIVTYISYQSVIY